MRKLAAGNWKMNGLKPDGLALAKELAARAGREKLGCELLICPPATLLHPVSEALTGSAVALGAQNCHAQEKGAHTGEISAAMLKDAGCAYVILGHSERRAEQSESDAEVRAKVVAARKAGLIAIVCIGETLAERDAGQTLAVVASQLQGSLPEGLGAAELVIAYEPVWAIGTGRTPTNAQVAEVHAHIRRLLATRMRDPADTRILYGGSVKPANARELMGVANVDGALVGGASLIAEDFWAIARACG
jgi:triosephosphate isomerase